MRRGVGVAAIKKKKEEASQYSSVGKSLEENKISTVTEAMESFRVALTTFAEKHRNQINSDAEFRQQFHKMCHAIGVDPLASNKGFWADLLGVGDFYYELGVVIIKISIRLRHTNGGIASLEEILRCIRTSTAIGKKNNVSIDDIIRAVEKLKSLGNGFRIISIRGSPYLVSVPMEMNKDHEEIFEMAKESGFVTFEMIENNLLWTRQRFDVVISNLLREEIVWIDLHNGVYSYYFPSLK